MAHGQKFLEIGEYRRTYVPMNSCALMRKKRIIIKIEKKEYGHARERITMYNKQKSRCQSNKTVEFLLFQLLDVMYVNFENICHL